MKKVCGLIALLLLLQKLQAQRIALADSLFQAQQWEQAARAYDSYLRSHPDEMPGQRLNRIGQCYLNLGQSDKAIEAYKKAIPYTNNPMIMYNVACAYSRLSQKDSALAWLERSADAGFTLYDATSKDEDLSSLHGDARFNTICGKIRKNLMPCSAQAESHQFDFWIGDWKVYNPQGQQVGNSKIEQILGECVILENWTDYYGNQGKSINVYNPSTNKWQQTWVDDKGMVTEYINGAYKDSAMIFPDSRPQKINGKERLHRLSFFKISADEVRQLGEISDDAGMTWKTGYDLKYIRVK